MRPGIYRVVALRMISGCATHSGSKYSDAALEEKRQEAEVLRDELGFAALGLISLQKDVGNRNQGDFQDGKGKPYPRESQIKDLNYEIKILRQAKDMLMKQQAQLHRQYHFGYGPY